MKCLTSAGQSKTRLLLAVLTAFLLTAGVAGAAANGSEYYPQLSQGYLSSPENAFLLTGVCEKYLWDYPAPRGIQEYAVESLHLGNIVGVRFNPDGQVNSCYSQDFEISFSYQDGRIATSTFYRVADGKLDKGTIASYEYPADDPDRVEIYTDSPKGKLLRTVYQLDGFELTITNARMDATVVKTYDYLGRLAKVSSNYATFVYDYDNNGFMVLESAGKGEQLPERTKIVSYSFATDGTLDLKQTQTVDKSYRADYLYHLIR